MWYNFAPLSEAEPCQGVKENNLSIWTLPARAFRADAISSRNGQPFDGVWYTIMVVASDIPYSARIEHVKFNETVLRIWKQRNYLYRLSSLSITQMHKAIALKRHTHTCSKPISGPRKMCVFTRKIGVHERGTFGRGGGENKEPKTTQFPATAIRNTRKHILQVYRTFPQTYTHRTLPIN